MKQFIVKKSTPVRNGETLCVSMTSLENETAGIFVVNGQDMSHSVLSQQTYVMYVPASTGIKVDDVVNLDMEKHFVAIEKTATNAEGETFFFTQIVTRAQHERYLAKKAEDALE